jgi:hypothetical protein
MYYSLPLICAKSIFFTSKIAFKVYFLKIINDLSLHAVRVVGLFLVIYSKTFSLRKSFAFSK